MAKAAPMRWEPQFAWQKITGRQDDIEVERVKKSKRSQIYRLKHREGNVIAKRCLEGTALREKLFYESVAAQSSIRLPRFLGFVSELQNGSGHEFCWLFLEDLGAQRHDPGDAGERSRLAEWLGRFARLTMSAASSVANRLPDRRLPYYRSFLGQSLVSLPALANRRRFSAGAQAAFALALNSLSAVQERWSELDELTKGAPCVLAHGDCLPKNIHVINEPGQPVVPIDWGSVGVGLPVMDLGVSAVSLDKSAQVVPDVEAYVFAIRPVWPELNTDTATRLAIAGRILWILKLIAQSTPVFHDYSGRKVEAHMSLYAQVLHESVSFMGWGKPSRNSTGG